MSDDYRIALRNDDHGDLDDVVVKDVSMFRAERMDDGWLWMCCYFADDSDQRLTFGVRAAGGRLEFYANETPEGDRFVYEHPPAALGDVAGRDTDTEEGTG